MKGRSRREKGAQFEREIAAELRRIFPDSKRGLGQARSGYEVADVEVPLFWVETKRQKNSNVRAFLRQADEATMKSPREYRIPLVVSCEDRATPIVTMHFEDFLALMEELLTHGGRRVLRAACPSGGPHGGPLRESAVRDEGRDSRQEEDVGASSRD